MEALRNAPNNQGRGGSALIAGLGEEELQALGGRDFWTRAFEQFLRYSVATEYFDLEALSHRAGQQGFGPTEGRVPTRPRR